MRRLIISLAAVLFIFAPGQSFSQKTLNNIDYWLPADFNPKENILLIDKIDRPKKQQEKMEEFMREKYAYPYEFVDSATINDPGSKYADSVKYRFILMNTFFRHTMHQNSSRPASQQISVGVFDFYFYDRLTKKLYPATQRGSSWASMTFNAMMNTILKKFE